MAEVSQPVGTSHGMAEVRDSPCTRASPVCTAARRQNSLLACSWRWTSRAQARASDGPGKRPASCPCLADLLAGRRRDGRPRRRKPPQCCPQPRPGPSPSSQGRPTRRWSSRLAAQNIGPSPQGTGAGAPAARARWSWPAAVSSMHQQVCQSIYPGVRGSFASRRRRFDPTVDVHRRHPADSSLRGLVARVKGAI